MYFHPNERIALLIDGMSLESALSALGEDIDYRRLRAFFAKKGRLVSAGFYVSFSDDAEYEAAGILGELNLLLKAGHRLDQLTYIEQKRVELARALATRPRVLLLDEWLSGLSPGELEGGMSVVWSLAAQGIAVILVEHVMTAVRALCSRVIVMNAGLKIAEGPPVEVLRDAEVIRAYLGDDHA